MAFNILNGLPGWEIILFISLLVIFLLVGGIVTFVIMSRLRWPIKYVVLENVGGQGYVTSRRGRCRTVGFGDGGEEIFLLKRLNKYKVGFGKRIGNKQIGWVVAQDGLWYQFSFGDFDKTLRELGVLPSSYNVRLSMSSVRKGLDKRLEPKDWLSKYGMFVGMGLMLLMLLIFGGIFYFTQQQQVKIAQLSAVNINASLDTQEATQKTLASLDNILSRINLNIQNGNTNNTIIGGSGLVPAT